MCQYLLDNGAAVNCIDRWKGSPLADALREGHTAVAQLLMARGGRLHWDDARTCSELCETARRGDVNGLGLLIRAGCDINLFDYDRRSALHVAASEGNVSMVQALLARHDIVLDSKDRCGEARLTREALSSPLRLNMLYGAH